MRERRRKRKLRESGEQRRANVKESKELNSSISPTAAVIQAERRRFPLQEKIKYKNLHLQFFS